MEDDASAIKDLGWRQGALLPSSLLSSLSDNGLLGNEDTTNALAVVVSHDCDVTHPSLEAEPLVDILLALKVDRAGRNNSARKFYSVVENDSIVLEFSANRLYRIQRENLSKCEPDQSLILSRENIDEIASWLARRYIRSGFPDEFNKRARKASDDARKKLKTDPTLFRGIHIFLSEEELAEGQDYDILVCGVMYEDKHASEDLRTKAEELIGLLANFLNSCEGITVKDKLVVPDDEFSLKDFRLSKRWDFDELSFRTGDLADVHGV